MFSFGPIKEPSGTGELIYEFECFHLDSKRRELRRGDEIIAIEPQVFDVLQFLIANRERVVSNDDLVEAIWHGRVVSDATVSTRMNAVRRAVGDSGERQQLIRTIARKGYRFVGKVIEHNTAQNEDTATSPVESRQQINKFDPEPGSSLAASDVSDKPSIAVLPFTNISGDPEQEYFADGISEDLIIGLSQFRWLFVIARNSSFVFKGQTLDAKRIARELGVRYLLEGSVRKAGRRVRITGQLIDAATGAHLWANRFDGALEDIFDLQDDLTANVVGAIAPKLERAEIERAKRKPTANLDAYDYFLRGMASLHQGTRQSVEEALRLFYRAIECDAGYAPAIGMTAWCYDLRKWNGWVAEPLRETEETERLARRAVELGQDDPVALCAAGFALAHVVGDLDFGAACIDRAIALNPNFAAAWYFGGWVSCFLGEPDVGIERIERALRLNPFDPFPFPAQCAFAWAHFVAGRYNESYLCAQKAVRERPNFLPGLRILAAACVMSDHPDEARKAIERVRNLDAAFRISDVKNVTRLRRPEDLARYEEALRKAGLPD